MSRGERLGCRQQLDESAEACDNLDNDCDGVVGDGALCTLINHTSTAASAWGMMAWRLALWAGINPLASRSRRPRV